MRSLFNDDPVCSYTEEAASIEKDFLIALKNVFETHLANGVSSRDLEYLALSVINDIAITNRLKAGAKMRIM